MSGLLLAFAVVNTALVAVMVKEQFFEARGAGMHSTVDDDNDFKPYVIFAKDGVDVTFRNPNVPENEGDEELSYKARIDRIQSCLPYLREYDESVKDENAGLMEDMPSHIPVFKEKSNMVDMSYSIKEYESKIAKDWSDYNLIRKLKYYKDKISEEKYDDIPGQGSDFKMPNMGLFNYEHYCNTHDSLLLSNPDIILNKMYFFSDYHPFSIPRWYGLGHYGQDTAPKISKNMKRLNWYQRIHGVDPRVGIFYTKKAGFHSYHQIGKHFACWGQSYNHIPGHGNLIRKDLLVTSANEYLFKHKRANKTQCFNEETYFPVSYRLYIEEECKEYFDLIQSEKYAEMKKDSEVQYILKVGYGVHRGAGVYLIDNDTEHNLLSNYSKGYKCGQMDENLVAQKYIYDSFTIDGGHKFDFRIYMMIASVDPLVVYYHDGFLRVSLFKYDKNIINPKAHLTNTELSKEVFKSVEDGGTHMGMDLEQLRNFQMRLLPEFTKYLLRKGLITDKDWINKKLKRDFFKAYIHLAKMVEKKLERNPALFEVFGVDFVMDEKFNIFVVEVNASPMQVGTSSEKTRLMKKMNQGIVKITLAYLRSRVKRSIQFIAKHKEDIKNGVNLANLALEFRELNRNRVEPEYEYLLEDISWEKITDENIKGKDAYYGLIEDECIDIMNQ